MKIVYPLFLLALLLSLSSCQLIQSILSAGVWVAVLLVVALAGLLTVLLAKLIDK